MQGLRKVNCARCRPLSQKTVMATVARGHVAGGFTVPAAAWLATTKCIASAANASTKRASAKRVHPTRRWRERRTTRTRRRMTRARGVGGVPHRPTVNSRLTSAPCRGQHRTVGMHTQPCTCRKQGWRSLQRMPTSERAKQT